MIEGALRILKEILHLGQHLFRFVGFIDKCVQWESDILLKLGYFIMNFFFECNNGICIPLEPFIPEAKLRQKPLHIFANFHHPVFVSL